MHKLLYETPPSAFFFNIFLLYLFLFIKDDQVYWVNLDNTYLLMDKTEYYPITPIKDNTQNYH